MVPVDQFTSTDRPVNIAHRDTVTIV